MALTQISTAGVKNDAVTSGKIPANAVGSSELADNAVDTAAIADQAVTLAKLPHGTSSNNGKFLRANNGADPTFETVNTDLVADTTPQLGGTLDTNGQDVNFIGDTSGRDVIFDASLNQIRAQDNAKLCAGTSSDLEIYHNGNNSFIENYTGNLHIKGKNGEESIVAIRDGAVELYHNNVKKFETRSDGGTLTGRLFADGLSLGDDEQIYLGANNDFHLYHDSSASENVIRGGYTALRIKDTAGRTAAYFQGGGQTELYHNNTKKFETTSTGVKIGDRVEFNGNTIFDNSANGNNIGLAFDSAGAITPTDGAANRVNNSKDLGTASYQWNDLHLGGSANIGNYIRTNYDGGAHVYIKNNSQGANFSTHFQTYLSSNENGTTQTHLHYYHGGYCELLHQGSSAIRTRSGGGVDFNNGGTRIGIFDPEGLKFGTDTSSSNALDDYEEGTFSPTYDGTWTNISNSNLRHARYTKIGNTVHIWMEYFMTNNNGAFANSSNIRNFPYSGPSSLYIPVVLGIMYGPSGYSMDQTSAGRAYFDAADDRLYFRMGSFSGVRHIWVQFTYTTG